MAFRAAGECGRSNLLRRIEELEARVTDHSGLVPKSQEWLEYWDRQVCHYMRHEPHDQLTLEGVQAMMSYCDAPASLVGRHLRESEQEADCQAPSPA
jgi:hypothetical protein